MQHKEGIFLYSITKHFN